MICFSPVDRQADPVAPARLDQQAATLGRARGFKRLGDETRLAAAIGDDVGARGDRRGEFGGNRARGQP